MRTLLSIRIPLAWFLLALIVAAAGGIVWLVAARGSVPGNSVLIATAPTSSAAVVSIGNTTNLSTPSSPQAPTVPITPGVIVVYVSGEVQAPGVYTLPVGSRVADAVAAAGGFSGEADREAVNLAAHLTDEQHISVPAVGTTAIAAIPTATGVVVEEKKSPGTSPTRPATPSGKVNINTASAEELEALPGIGSVLAGRIVSDREANGPFKTVDDLMRVPGIKEGIMSQLRALITVGP